MKLVAAVRYLVALGKRGLLFHGPDGAVLEGKPRGRMDYARGCALGAVCRSGQVRNRSGSIERIWACFMRSSRHWWAWMTGDGSVGTFTQLWRLPGTIRRWCGRLILKPPGFG